MEQLVGFNMQVVLSLKEGRGFQGVANSTCIVSTLDGQSLETDGVEPDANPKYTTDLVWKADKCSLRKMRSGQEPLKIECFEIKENGRRDRIGYAILSLRTARILSKDGDSNVTASWHKLLGLRNDLKVDKPELLVALTIEDHETYIRRISQTEIASSKERAQDDFPIAVPYLNEKERLIQLGPVTTCDCLFLLNIIAGTARNLPLLKEAASGAPNENYSLWYRVLENDVQLKVFDTLEDTFVLNEPVLIKIRSSREVLRNYLSKVPNFLLILQRGEIILGHSELDLTALIPEEQIGADTVLNHRCYLVNERTPINTRDGENNRAFLDLQLKLRYVDPRTTSHERQRTDSTEIFAQEYAYPEINTHRNPCGDFGTFSHGQRRMSKSLYTDATKFVSDRNEIDAVPPRIIAQDDTKSLEAYHCYCLNVRMIGIKLSSSVRNIEFRFHHPKAEIMSTVYPKMPLSRNEQLRLQDIGCKLLFISAADEIRHLLMSNPPKVSIYDVGNETKYRIGQAVIDVARLFHQSKLECKYEASLYDSDKNEIGTLDVALYLEDDGPYYKTCNRSSDENLGPPIIDDSLAYKIVDELETWKERQQEIFRVELRRKEERHLNRLSEEWQQRRETLEAKLACSVEQCKMLANSLNKATEDLRTRRLKSLEKEARLIKANEDLQWRYESNVQQQQDAARRFQEEHASKITGLEERRNNLEAQNESLRLENERLRRSATEQEEELRAYQKGCLTQDQTAALLQDVKALEQKLCNTQKRKAFFKEEWGKAVREIHRMKMEQQRVIGVQIKASKEELKNLDLEEVLGVDSTALTNDRVLLGQIQKEIDVMKPTSLYSRKEPTSQHTLTAQDIQMYPRDCGKSQRSSATSDRQDERLRKLIEERDALLKTGSYTIDDGVIVKLNSEIRSLLIVN